MNYPDADTTKTDWSNFKRQNDTECCPVTGVSRIPGYVEVEYSSATPIDNYAKIGGQSKSKLGAMFNKFLYQK